MVDKQVQLTIMAKDMATSTLNKVGASVSNLGSTTKNSLNTTFDLLRNNIVKTGALAGGLIASFGLMAKEAINTASQFEQWGVAFTTIIGNTEEAKKTLSDLVNFAATTPFEIPGLMESAQKLLAYGTASSDLVPTLKMLGDIAAGVGMDKLPQLIMAFGQVQAATVLTGMELRQFTEAGVPLLDVLAQRLNTSAAAVKDMISAGAVTFADVKAALGDLTGEGGKFQDLMIKQSQTLGGMLSNLADRVTLLKLKMVGVTETGEVKEGGIFANLEKQMSKLLIVMEKVEPAMTRFFEMVSANTDFLIVLGGAIGGLLLAILIALIVTLGEAVIALAFFAAIGSIVAFAVYKIIDNWGLIKEFFSTLWENVKTTFLNATLSLTATITNFVEGLRELISIKIPQFFEELPNKIKDFLYQSFLRFVEFLGFMTVLINEGVPAIISAIENFWAELPMKIWKSLEKINLDIQDLWNFLDIWIPNKTEDIVNGILAFFSALVPRILAFWNNIKSDAKTVWPQIWQAINDELSSWPGRLEDWGKKMVESLRKGIESKLNDIKDAFKKGMDNARSVVEGQSPPREGPFKDIDKWGYNIGAAWVGGIQQAVQDFKLNSISLQGANVPTAAPQTYVANVYIGMYAGNETEKRRIAEELMKEFKYMASARGRSVVEEIES